MIRRIVPSTDLSATATATPADIFSAQAEGKAWFVRAEMRRPLGGRKSGGHRPFRLEVTVRFGGRAEAEALMSRLHLDGHIDEQPRVPHGGRLHGRR